MYIYIYSYTHNCECVGLIMIIYHDCIPLYVCMCISGCAGGASLVSGTTSDDSEEERTGGNKTRKTAKKTVSTGSADSGYSGDCDCGDSGDCGSLLLLPVGCAVSTGSACVQPGFDGRESFKSGKQNMPGRPMHQITHK